MCALFQYIALSDVEFRKMVTLQSVEFITIFCVCVGKGASSATNFITVLIFISVSLLCIHSPLVFTPVVSFGIIYIHELEANENEHIRAE